MKFKPSSQSYLGRSSPDPTMFDSSMPWLAKGLRQGRQGTVKKQRPNSASSTPQPEVPLNQPQPQLQQLEASLPPEKPLWLKALPWAAGTIVLGSAVVFIVLPRLRGQ